MTEAVNHRFWAGALLPCYQLSLAPFPSFPRLIPLFGGLYVSFGCPLFLSFLLQKVFARVSTMSGIMQYFLIISLILEEMFHLSIHVFLSSTSCTFYSGEMLCLSFVRCHTYFVLYCSVGLFI